MASLWKRIVVQCTGRGILMFMLVVMAILTYTFVKFFLVSPAPVDRGMSVGNYRTSNRMSEQKKVSELKIEQPKPEKPVQPKKPSRPIELPKKEENQPEKPAEPPKDKKEEEPHADQQPKEQSREEKHEEPPKEKPAEPPKEKPAELPKEEKQQEPPKEKPDETNKEEKHESPPKEEKQEDKPSQKMEDKPPQPPNEQKPVEEKSEKPQMEEKPINVDKKAEPIDKEQRVEPPKEDKKEAEGLPQKEQQERKNEKPQEPEAAEPPKEKTIEEPQQQPSEQKVEESISMEQHRDIPLNPNEAHSVVRQLQQTGNTLLDHFLANDLTLKPTGFGSWVHLDLKGAAPSIDYLIQLVPLLKQWGATGILVEYEDMFPWQKEIEVIRASNAYSPESLKRFIKVAKSNELEVIPLIQTLGHMELLLKHATFQSLREDQRYPAFLNPAKPLSLVVLKVMIDQILDVHGEINYIHIGCDEVYIMGTSQESKTKMKQENYRVPQLYLEHVKTLANYVKSKRPGVQTLIWDDMLRQMSVEDLKTSDIASHIEPVVWSYSKMVQDAITDQVWDKYAQVFTKVWVGSAFKGASGAVQHLPELSVHLQNHANWVEVVRKLQNTHPNLNVEGFVLTGWSRYDHFSALCDLLPASIPSLVACLQIVKSGTWNPRVIQDVSSLLQCTGPVFALNPETLHFGYAFEVPTAQEVLANNFKKQCSFPGDDIFYIILLYHEALQTFEKYFDPITGQTRGQCNRFSLGHSFINPFQVETLCSSAAERVMNVFKLVDERVPVVFRAIYSDSVASEWLEEHVITFETWLEQYNTNVKSAASKSQVWGERPGKFLDKDRGGTGMPT